MKILHGSDISKSIALVNPERVAVAYIGIDWKQYIPDYEKLESIIISPTFGSNPYAIKELVSVLGWEKVFFLDELHAKLYLGAELAVMGSANLTSNGLLGTSLEELCCEVDDLEKLSDLTSFYDDLIGKSKTKYPRTECKKERLSKCFDEWDKAVSNGFVNKNIKENSFDSFELFSSDQFYVIWYFDEDLDFSDEIKDLESRIESHVFLANDDPALKNKWALLWKITNKNMPDKRTKPSWLYIHDIFDHAHDEKENADYRKVAIQWSDLELPNVPFELTKPVIDAFRSAVVNERNRSVFVQEDEIFYTTKLRDGLYNLVDDMKIELGIK